jgi:hypothetical protein
MENLIIQILLIKINKINEILFMIHISSLINIGSGIQMLIGGYT